MLSTFRDVPGLTLWAGHHPYLGFIHTHNVIFFVCL
ncbi:rCG23612, isoform CRA_a [Rattus norvegicus]|uniref:RCG23612, isoform CRA_a n=1 Tax=Rattus norvegicus TaxID=10116 RepID=A6KPP1_RAT|nr:rCG23612, isoform CRA_a [Rattus norvegicus]